MKYVVVVLTLVAMLLSCGPKMQTQEELEERFGPLTQFTPKAVFVHFKTADGKYQIDCLKMDGQYVFLTKDKIRDPEEVLGVGSACVQAVFDNRFKK